jgi:hypothetical protein
MALPSIVTKRPLWKQQRHTRDIITSHGPKRILVNPGIIKKRLAIMRRMRSTMPVQKIKPKLPVPWSSIIKRDNTKSPWFAVKGVMPSEERKKRWVEENLFSFEHFVELCEILPDRNFEEWKEEVISDLNRLKEDYYAGKLNPDDAEEEVKKLAETWGRYIVEADPEATIYYSDNDIGEITRYRSIEAEGIETEWHSNNAWRGYYDAVLDPAIWAELHDDVSLYGSNDQQDLAEFDKKLRAELDKQGIRWARIMLRTSNIFSSGYTFAVEAQRAKEAKQIREKLIKGHRSKESFMAEANPLYQQTKEAMKKLSGAQVKQILSDKTTPETEKLLDKAISQVEKEKKA